MFREELIVYSAHQVKTTTKTFRRLKRAIERNPQLGARIARTSNRIGAERIELATGQAVEMVALIPSRSRRDWTDATRPRLARIRETVEFYARAAAAGAGEVLSRDRNRAVYAAQVALIDDQLVDRVGKAAGDDLVPAIAQRKREQLGDLGGVVDQKDPSSAVHFLAAPVPGSRFFLPSDGSRSSTHTRPPAVK